MMFGGDEEDRGGEGHGSKQDKTLEVFRANMWVWSWGNFWKAWEEGKLEGLALKKKQF